MIARMRDDRSVIDLWRDTTGRDDVAELTRGLFTKLGVRVTDTGEELTVARNEAGLTLAPALDENAVDYVVDITSDQARRLSREAGERGPLDPIEQYRVVSALFTAATAATLRKPRLSSPLLRFVTGAESLIHVCLTSPDPAAEPDTCHSLVYAARQWLVIGGLHGRPQRSFRMDVGETLEYHRRVVAVMREETPGKWLDFAKWYPRVAADGQPPRPCAAAARGAGAVRRRPRGVRLNGKAFND